MHTPEDTVRVLQRTLYLSAKADPKRTYGVLYDKIYRPDVLSRAWLSVKANRGAAGVDGISIAEIEDTTGVQAFLRDVQNQLRHKRYRPAPVRRVYIPKADGRQRPLGIPTVRDRVVQSAVRTVIEPIFEADFMNFSYGFRPKRSAAQAVEEIRKHLNWGKRQVIDADLKSYFDTIPKDNLKASVRKRIADNGINKLIALWLDAGVMEDLQVRKQLTGTPQGGVISPLLANIYLHWLDYLWVQRGYQRHAPLVRYADDFVVLCDGQAEYFLERAKEIITRLGLAFNQDKTRILNANKEPLDFLGVRFVVQPSKRTGKMLCFNYPSPKAVKSIKAKVRGVISAGQHKKLPELIQKEVNPLIQGWAHYFIGTNARETFRHIDTYVHVTLCIMLRKKFKKRSKGWRDHPPSWFREQHKLVSLNELFMRLFRTKGYGHRHKRS